MKRSESVATRCGSNRSNAAKGQALRAKRTYSATLPFALSALLSRSEPVSVLLRIHKPVNHVPRVSRLVQHIDPVQIQSVRIASQITKVLHHHECLVEEFRGHFVGLDNLPQHLGASQRSVVQSVDPPLPRRGT